MSMNPLLSNIDHFPQKQSVTIINSLATMNHQSLPLLVLQPTGDISLGCTDQRTGACQWSWCLQRIMGKVGRSRDSWAHLFLGRLVHDDHSSSLTVSIKHNFVVIISLTSLTLTIINPSLLIINPPIGCQPIIKLS